MVWTQLQLTYIFVSIVVVALVWSWFKGSIHKIRMQRTAYEYRVLDERDDDQ